MKSAHFKPETSALVLIDHQVGTLQLVKNLPSDVSLRNTINLGKAAKALGMPVVMTCSQEDRIQGPIAPSLQRVLPEAYEKRIRRQGVVNAWGDPRFRQAVVDTGRKQLVMAAVTTDICLVFPAISAVEEGFEVQAVMDASGGRQSRCRLKVHAGSDSAWCRRGAFEVLAAIAGTMLVVGGAPMRSPSAARALV
jgi:nicotinamidase-related amidase